MMVKVKFLDFIKFGRSAELRQPPQLRAVAFDVGIGGHGAFLAGVTLDFNAGGGGTQRRGLEDMELLDLCIMRVECSDDTEF